MRYTDENGKEYIGVADFAESSIVIAPVVKAESKYSVVLDWKDRPEIIVGLTNLTLDQAQLIKDCCERLMAYLFDDPNYVWTANDWPYRIKEARQSMSLKGEE